MTYEQIDTLIARTASRLLPWDPNPITGLGGLMGRMIAELREQPVHRLRDYARAAVFRDGASDADYLLLSATVRQWRRATEQAGPSDPVMLACLLDGYAAIERDPSVVVTALIGCAPRPPPELRRPAPRQRRKAQRPTVHDAAVGRA